MDKEDKFFLGVLLCIAILMMLLGFWSDAKSAVPYYSDEKASYEAGLIEGQELSYRLIYESQFKDMGASSLGLEPPLPSFWEACMKANPKLNTEHMDMFVRLWACTAWYHLGRKIKIIAGWRSKKEHEKNLKNGTSKVKVSLHQLGYAFDFSWCKNKKCTKLIGGKLSDEDLHQLLRTSGKIDGIEIYMKYFYRGFYASRSRVCSSGDDWNCDHDIRDGWDAWHKQCPPYSIAKRYACKKKPSPLDYL